MPNRQTSPWPHSHNPHQPAHQNTKTRLRATPYHTSQSRKLPESPPNKTTAPTLSCKEHEKEGGPPGVGPARCALAARRGWGSTHRAISLPPPTRSRDHVFIGRGFPTRCSRGEPAADANGSSGRRIGGGDGSSGRRAGLWGLGRTDFRPFFELASKILPRSKTEEHRPTNASTSPASPRGQRACGAEDAVVGGEVQP